VSWESKESQSGSVAVVALPELNQAEAFAVLLGAEAIGVGIAQAAAVLALGEKGQDTGAGHSPPGQVMTLQSHVVWAVSKGMKIEGERVGRGE
jgi:hypothetical protein